MVAEENQLQFKRIDAKLETIARALEELPTQIADKIIERLMAQIQKATADTMAEMEKSLMNLKPAGTEVNRYST